MKTGRDDGLEQLHHKRQSALETCLFENAAFLDAEQHELPDGYAEFDKIKTVNEQIRKFAQILWTTNGCPYILRKQNFVVGARIARPLFVHNLFLLIYR